MLFGAAGSTEREISDKLKKRSPEAVCCIQNHPSLDHHGSLQTLLQYFGHLKSATPVGPDNGGILASSVVSGPLDGNPGGES